MVRIFISQENAGPLRVRGQHQLDFLQRQVTNDVRLLTTGKVLAAVLTTPAARILDGFYLFLEEAPPAAGEPAGILALSIANRAGATAAYLKSRIFFMDRVGVEDASREYTQVDLFGLHAGEVLGHLGLPDSPEEGEIALLDLPGFPLQVFQHLAGVGLGFRLIAPAEASSALKDALRDAGAREISAEEYDIQRVEAGVPAGAKELTEEYTPLEVSLRPAISEAKGCYTGQEVIARQITYDKIARGLVGLRLESPAAAGAEVRADGKSAGTVTSAVISPRFGPIALAVLRKVALEPGSKVGVMSGSGEVKATVSALPFR